MSPDTVFSITSSTAMAGWLLLILAPRWPALIAFIRFGLIGALSLRTRGLYFIMITLAFAQLVFYVSAGLEAYGADDGLNISRSRFPGLIDLRVKTGEPGGEHKETLATASRAAFSITASVGAGSWLRTRSQPFSAR